MYKRRILWSLLFAKTPTYPGRSFLKAKLEGLEYAILLSAIDNSKKALRYITTPSEQESLIFNWGKMWVLIDDIQDELPEVAPDSFLRALLTGGKTGEKFVQPLLTELKECADYVNSRVKQTKHWGEYQRLSLECFDSQKLASQSRLKSDLLHKTLQASERKGGAFVLSLILALNPEDISSKVAKAFYMGGSWGQAIDDFADVDKDKSNKVYTVFSASAGPEPVFHKLSVKYESAITSLLERDDIVIPVSKDLTQLVRFSKLPVIRYIFNYLNRA